MGGRWDVKDRGPVDVKEEERRSNKGMDGIEKKKKKEESLLALNRGTAN